MIKRKKDGGFTLIELMIVIAVIGILAVVLAPKMSGIKDSAKESGVITNAKSIEAFVVANIDKWNRTGSDDADTIINTQFTTTEVLENPLNLDGAAIVVHSSPTAAVGVVTVAVPGTPAKGYLESTGIVIKAYGNGTGASDVVYEKTIMPN